MGRLLTIPQRSIWLALHMQSQAGETELWILLDLAQAFFCLSAALLFIFVKTYYEKGYRGYEYRGHWSRQIVAAYFRFLRRRPRYTWRRLLVLFLVFLLPVWYLLLSFLVGFFSPNDVAGVFVVLVGVAMLAAYYEFIYRFRGKSYARRLRNTAKVLAGSPVYILCGVCFFALALASFASALRRY